MKGHHVPESDSAGARARARQTARPLVGTAAQGGVIGPDVLWSCVSCGACVERCPVDIEHVDHIIDMRRYQVMMESSSPPSSRCCSKTLRPKPIRGARTPPTGPTGSARSSSTFRSTAKTSTVFRRLQYLFWVGCAGAYDDKARKPPRPSPAAGHRWGVKYLVLGTGEAATATRLVARVTVLFQQLAQQAVETVDGLFEGVKPSTTDRRHLPALLQHPGPRIPATRRQLHRAAPHAAARPAGTRQEAGARQPVSRHHLHDPCYLGGTARSTRRPPN